MTEDAPTEEPGPVVNHLLHPLAQEIRALLDPAQRASLDTILIDDDENIVQALGAGVALRTVFHTGDRALSDALAAALPESVPVHEVATRTGKKLFQNEKISRTFAIAERPSTLTLDALADGTRDLVALEEIAISGNIGAIIRSARALGAGAVVLLGATPDALYDRRLIRASRGHLFALPVVAASREEFLAFAQAREIPLALTAADGEATLDEIAAEPRRLAWLFGSEKGGASDALASAAAHRVRIPIDPAVESLNVSVAAAITLYARHGWNMGRA